MELAHLHGIGHAQTHRKKVKIWKNWLYFYVAELQ